jgi:hypothetical protein
LLDGLRAGTVITRNHAGIVASLYELEPADVVVCEEIKPDVSAADAMGHTGPPDKLSDTDGCGASTDHIRAVLVPIPAAVMDQDGATKTAGLLGPAVPLQLGLFVPEWVILAHWLE